MKRIEEQASRHHLYISMYKRIRVLTDGIVDIQFLCEVLDNSIFLSTEAIFM